MYVQLAPSHCWVHSGGYDICVREMMTYTLIEIYEKLDEPPVKSIKLYKTKSGDSE